MKLAWWEKNLIKKKVNKQRFLLKIFAKTSHQFWLNGIFLSWNSEPELSLKYYNHILQTNTRHREEEPQNTNMQSQDIRKPIEVKQPALSLFPEQDDCKTRRK